MSDGKRPFARYDVECPQFAPLQSKRKLTRRIKGVTPLRLVTVLGRDVKHSMQAPEDTAMAVAALCIGGMVVARSLKDSRFSHRLRDAATHAALVLGGWKRDATTLPNTSPSANSPAVLKRTRKDLRRTTSRVRR